MTPHAYSRKLPIVQAQSVRGRYAALLGSNSNISFFFRSEIFAVINEVAVFVGNYMFCNVFNEVSYFLDMHLGLCNPRRSQVAPSSYYTIK